MRRSEASEVNVKYGEKEMNWGETNVKYGEKEMKWGETNMKYCEWSEWNIVNEIKWMN